MENVYGEQQQHKFHPSHELYFHKRTLREIDIPPRKLLNRHTSMASDDMFMDSPKGEYHKFLPYNNVDENDDDEDDDPYSSEHFRMYEFKVRKCTRSRSHDWTDCPFAHPGEKARRRDPRRFHYSGTVCAEFRRGSCSRGDNCEFAHGVFECWLHPSRYRTEACKDGKNCKRKICFFAHTPRQLRLVPINCNENVEKKTRSPLHHHCCGYCHSTTTTTTASPTSTLIGMSHCSPPLSPDHSPGMKFSPVSWFRDSFESFESSNGSGLRGMKCYEDATALAELISSLDAMNIHKATNNGNSRRVDVNFNVDNAQQQFVLSPSTPSPAGFSRSIFANRSFLEEDKYNDNGLTGPDFGWVNDLLT